MPNQFGDNSDKSRRITAAKIKKAKKGPGLIARLLGKDKKKKS